MANFVGPIKTKSGKDVFLNADLIAGFSYDEDSGRTTLYFVGEEGAHEYPGDLTETFFPTWRRCYD